MTNESHYSRLPGRSGFFVSHSLWMSNDHVLSVRRNPFSESYRRYYFADIQAVVLTELPNLVAPYGYATSVLLFVTAAALLYTRHPAWAIFCALVSLAAFLCSRRSADCAGYLQTSVSSEMLPSMRRQASAAKALALLKAEIERTQGSVSAEVLQAHPSDTRVGRVAALKPALRHCSGVVHWMVFALMLVRGAMLAVFLKNVVSVPFNFAASGVGALTLLLLVLAAIQQRNSGLALEVRRLIYVALTFYLASGLGTFAASIYVAFSLGQRTTSRAMIEENSVFKAFEAVELIGYCVLGLVGLILMWRYQRTVRTPPPLALGNSG